MDFNPASAKNRHIEQIDGSISNSIGFRAHHLYSYGPSLPEYSITFPTYTMHPNAAIEQAMGSGLGANFPSGAHESWPGGEMLGTVSSQFQDLQLSDNSEPRFDSTSQAETRAFYAELGQQDWSHQAATKYFTPNEVGTFPEASLDSHLHFSITEPSNRYNEPTIYNGMPNGSDFIWQDNASRHSFANGFEQDMSLNLLQTSEESNSLGNSGFSTQSSSSLPNTGTNFSSNAYSQFPTSTYNTSIPLHQSFTHSIVSPSTAESSLSSQSATSSSSSATSPPVNPPSPESTLRPCLYPTCESTFKRLGDMKRHARIHDPARHRKYYHCWAPGCNRNGRNGFTRRDKFRNHARVHKDNGLEEDLEDGF